MIKIRLGELKYPATLSSLDKTCQTWESVTKSSVRLHADNHREELKPKLVLGRSVTLAAVAEGLMHLDNHRGGPTPRLVITRLVTLAVVA